MFRPTRFQCLLTLLTVISLQNVAFTDDRGVAQTAPVPICNPEQPLETRIWSPLEQARTAVDQGESETAIRSLQEALPIALSLKQSRTQADLISQWLISDESNLAPRFERLISQADKTQSAQLRSLLDQLFQLTQRLTPANSLIKTRALAAIARHYAIFNQRQIAANALTQAREAARFIQGAPFRAIGLLDIAAGYSAIAQAQTAQSILAQVEQYIPQIPPARSMELLQRLAVIYAQTGNDAKAKEIVAKLPKTSDQSAIALREIAKTYLTTQKLDRAEQLIQTIAIPAQKALALGQLAVAYDNAKQSDKATQRFRQAVQLARSPAVTRDRTMTPEQVIKELITNYLSVGRRDEAKQLAQTDLKIFQKEAFKAIVLADVQAKQPDRAKQLLSQWLTKIQNSKDDWQRFERSDLIKTATEARLFDWMLQEWTRISAIDFGLQDLQLETITRAYAQNGQHTQALKWVEQLPIANRPLSQIKLRSAIALMAHRSGQTAWAKNLLQQTQQRIGVLQKASRERLEREGGDATEPDDIEYFGLGVIALTYAEIGEAETTRQLLDRVIRLKSSVEDSGLGGRTDNPFNLFLEAKQAIGALQLAQGTQNPQGREYRLQSVTTLLLNQNRFDLVVPIVDQLTPVNSKTQLLLAIAQRYTEIRQPEKALPILAQAFKLARTIPGDESEVDRLGTDGTTIIDKTDDRGSLIEAIAIQYARLKQRDQALRVANTLQGQQARDQALREVRCAIGS